MDRLHATVQPYSWGDLQFIARLQGREPTGAPEAELWMGAHPKAPATLVDAGVGLDQAIAADPDGMLGPAASFGELPFLAKILAAREPLSIQTHPSAEQARVGFARENDAGVPIDAPTRTYRDGNHKPELICALTPFVAKCGFRRLDQTRALFAELDDPSLDPVREMLHASGDDREVLAQLLGWLLRLPATEAAAIAAGTVRASRGVGGPFAAETAWCSEIAAIHPGDIGVTVALLLNHVVLEPGEAVFLGAGNLHAYLRGAGVELMANSDNVVRGGLTPKHVDVEELLRVVDPTPIDVPVQTAGSAEHAYDSPVVEFSLTRVQVDGEYQARVHGPEIVIATEGSFLFTAASGRQVVVDRGEPVWVAASDEDYVARGTGVLFRSQVGGI